MDVGRALREYEIVQYFNVSVFSEWPAIGPSVRFRL